ncbi:response regulator [bacterium]|nr:response regulator [bacterium]MBU1599774.1 response regulator [bacterium]
MSQEKILVVEDTPLNMELCRDLLEVAGYTVYEATDARQAIEQAKQERFDLILMDIQLPGMDGLSVTRIIKGESINKETPIVALTAYAMAGDKEKIEAAGCDGYITKPINTREFAQTIAGFLRRLGKEDTKIL